MTADLPSEADVVIVGAGLAGLAAARQLHANGVDAVVVEAADRVGGRVSSDVIDGLGIPLDRGFQVFNPAYPEAARVLDYADLELQSFAPGVLVRIGSRLWSVGDPRRLPAWSVSAVRAPIGSPIEKAKLARYAAHVAYGSVRDIEHSADVSMAEALNHAGLSGTLYGSVLRPFLAGVFLDADLTTSRRFGDLALRSFVRGTPAIPLGGMQAIPEQLAAALPHDTVHLNTRVTAVTDNGVQTDNGFISARDVIVATDVTTAADLIGIAATHVNAVTTWYVLADVSGVELAGGRSAIVVDGEGGKPLVNAVVLSNVVRDHAHDPQALISCSALTTDDSAEMRDAVIRHLARLFGRPTRHWEFVRSYVVSNALPAMRPPFNVRRPVRLSDHRYVAGDHRDTSSIQGALVSGRRAATALLTDRKITPTEEPTA